MNQENDNVRIYQIFYDEATKSQLDPGFIPLDNSDNARPDWYELWPIRNFLISNDLQDNTWYGFLSPKFGQKTGLSSVYIKNILQNHGKDSDVLLFSYAWDQLSYFLNPFEQGEYWHPGISSIAQQFFNMAEVNIDVGTFVTCCNTSCFSNYIIAKASYWKQWLALANKFFSVTESGVIPELVCNTSYVSQYNQVPIKTFIQERLSSVVLSQGGFKVLSLDQSLSGLLFTMLFDDNVETRRRLQACDLLKEKYIRTYDKDYLKAYLSIRSDIKIKN